MSDNYRRAIGDLQAAMRELNGYSPPDDVDFIAEPRSLMTVSPAADRPCRLDECPPGLFLFGETLGFKSEYGEANSLDVFCCDSGEYFWGGTSNREELYALMVMPMAVVPGAQ